MQIDTHLQEQDWAIEPANDGGINIIGINKNNFSPKEFQQLPWQTDQLLNEFVATVRNTQQKLSILCSTPDFDNKADIDLWLQQPKNSILSFLIRSILYKKENSTSTIASSEPTCSLAESTSLRAPPSA